MASQLALDDRWTNRPSTPDNRPTQGAEKKPALCASCQAREARYGFKRDADDPQLGRSRTLCFECFRVEISRRQEAAQSVQARLPLDETLELLSRRRRRAQIAARRALAVSGL